MPPLDIVGMEWLNQNALRKFPLADDATCLDLTGTITLPNSALVDMVLPVAPAIDYELDRFHLFEVSVFGSGAVFTFGYTPTGGTAPDDTAVIGSVAVSLSAHEPNTSYLLQGVPGGDFDGVTGKVTVGDLEDLARLGGTYQFGPDEGRLLATLIRPDIRGVTSIQVVNGDDVSTPVYGNVQLVAGQNVSIEVGSDNGIVISAIDTGDFEEACTCVEAGQGDRDLPECIRTINGVPPATGGNLTLTSAACMEISGADGGLNLQDTCSTPCCDSKELERIIADMNQLAIDVRTQLGIMQQLETRLLTMSALADAISATGFIIEP